MWIFRGNFEQGMSNVLHDIIRKKFYLNVTLLEKKNEDSIGASPLVGDYHNRRNQLNFCVRNGNRCFLITMAVFNSRARKGYIKFAEIKSLN